MSNEKPTLLDWLQLNRSPDFSKHQWLGAGISSLLGLILLSLIVFGVVALVLFYGAIVGFGPFANDASAAAIRNLGLVLVAMFGAPFLVWRSIVAHRQVNIAEQSQITDRINKAVQGLGAEKTVKENFEIPLPEEEPESELTIRQQRFDKKAFERTVPNLEVRIGAIYALERIAKDSLRDHLQIMEILCAYIRENAPASTSDGEPLFNPNDPRTDVQVAITVIGRRTNIQADLEQQMRFRLDLRNTDLSGVDFTKGNFSAAKFNNCKFEGAFFDKSSLKGTIFALANIKHCSFFGAKLWGTRFDGAEIDRPNPEIGSRGPSPFMGDIKAVSIMGAEIFALNFHGENEKAKQMFGSSTTSLPHTFQFNLDEYQRSKYLYNDLIESGETEEAKKLEEEIFEKFRFTNWSTNASYDPKSIRDYRNFQIENGLVGWPYQDD